MIVIIHCACTIAEPLLKTTEIKFGVHGEAVRVV